MADVKVPALLHKMSKASQKAWYSKHGMRMPDDLEGRSAAAAKKVKVAPRKMIDINPGSVRALNAARQQAYMAKGGRQPIGAMGSGGSNVMAGGGQSTVKDLKASIKAGFNPRVSLDPYESQKAKKTGPRSLKMKNESIDEAMSPEAAKKKRIFDLKLKMIKKVANYKSYTKPSKVDEPHTSLNPAADMKLNPKAPSGSGKDYYREEVQIDEVTGYEGVKDRKDMIKRAAAMSRMGKDVFLARVKARAAEMKKEKAAKELAKEEIQIDEVSKKEAEAMLGGPVKEKPKMPAGKQPAGYRYVRNLARKAMKKGAVGAVHKSMERTMQKEETEITEASKDDREYGYEGDMAMSQLKSIIMNAQKLHDMLEPNTDLPEWVQLKITLAEDYIVTAANYCATDLDEEAIAALNAEIAEEVELFEKAPPGSKYERMVKHIKKGYAKGGLTTKEKSIAYATAWKAYNKANEEVEQINEGATHWEYSGTVNGKDYSIKVKRGGDLSSVSHKSIMKQNPHLEPHEAKAVHETSGEDEEHVEVEHEGKKYTHHVTNHQEPRMVYGEEVEQVEEKYMGFAAVKKAVAAKGARNPAAVAAAIGRKKYGKEKFQAMAAAGKRKANEEVEQIDEVGGLVAAVKKYGEAGYVHDQAGTKQSRAELSVAKKQMTAAAKERGISPKRAMKVADRITMRAHGDDSYKDNRVGKMKEEVVTEAEGKVAVTPKEKALAAHHGDPKRITYGDVIKARLKSAAAKKMGK